MWTADPAVTAALAGNHHMAVKVTVLTGDGGAVDIPVQPGSKADATIGTQVNRTATIVVNRAVVAAGLLNPLTDRVMMSTGVAGLPLIPVFTGRVVALDTAADGKVQAHCASHAADLIGAPFEQPWAAAAGGTATTEIGRIIRDVDTGFTVTVAADVDADEHLGVLVWETDRGKALDELAAGINALWMPDRTGGFVVFANPFAAAAEPEPVAVFRDGESGALVDVQAVTSREHIINSVTVVVERTDGTPPIRVTARDTGPTSPTRWAGPFGKRSAIIKTQTPLDLDCARDLAARTLAQSIALARSWRITLPHYPLLDPGDVVAVWYRDEVTAQFIESVTYNLAAADTTNIATRELITTNTISKTITTN